MTPPPLEFDGYSIFFAKHDETENAREYDLDSGVGEGTKIRTWTIPIYIMSASSTLALGDGDEFHPFENLHPLPPQAAPWMGPIRDDPVVGESQVAGNATPPPPLQLMDDNVMLGKNPTEHQAAISSPKPQTHVLSPTTQDFEASGGMEADDRALVHVQTSPIPLAFEDQAPVATKVSSKLVTLSPCIGSARSLYSLINFAHISHLDIDLDLMLPPYLSLNMVVDIMKLIKDDNATFQGVSKKLLLECLEDIDEVDTPTGAVVLGPH
jgi:hypothetical protein